tara:strand:- start:357 stop:578 length:222 start_codon:yes stop_codon:yes gene_type:complete
MNNNLMKQINDYEFGNLTFNEEIKLFSELIKQGHAYRLQSHYGNYARELISLEFLDEDGKILKLESKDGVILK